MSENVQIALVVVVGLVVVVCVVVAMLKNRLSKGNIKVNRDGVQGGVEAQTPAEPPVTKISGTTIKGDKNKMSASDGGQIEQTDVEGHENQLDSSNG